MNFILDCNHYNTALDQHNGCYVCMECGLVQDSYFYNNNYKTDIKQNNISISNKIKDLLHNFNMENTSLGEDLQRDMSKISSNKHIQEYLAAFMYYHLLNNNHYTRLFQVCLACEADEKIVWNLLKNMNLPIVDISFPLENICLQLGLTYNDFKNTLNDIRQTKHSGHNPLTIIGGHLYKNFKEKISINEIANLCNLTPTSIKRYYNKYLQNNSM